MPPHTAAPTTDATNPFDLHRLRPFGPVYQRIFPMFWEYPAVRGVTLWGFLPGHWRKAPFIALEGGTERPALVWLREIWRAPRSRPC